MRFPSTLASLLIVVLIVIATYTVEGGEKAPYYPYTVINTFPHDNEAFTQGFTYYQGKVYESTGLFDKSTLRRVDLNSGEIERQIACDNNIFGEGMTILGKTIYQLTWKNHIVLLYNADTLALQKVMPYPREGWGLTTNNNQLIASDGSAMLYFLDVQTLELQNIVTVHNGSSPVYSLNELEYINGKVFANIYKSDRVAIIDPNDGRVEGWLDLSPLRRKLSLKNSEAVTNGIMYDSDGDRIFVTGKLWPVIYQIKIAKDK